MPGAAESLDWIGNHKLLLSAVGSVSVVVLIASVWMVRYFLITIPADYFSSDRKHVSRWRDSHPAVRGTLLAGKNLLGACLILAGLVMFFTPGQGMLTLLLGMSLVDFPGKRALERWIIEQPLVLPLVNRLRSRANRPPLVLG